MNDAWSPGASVTSSAGSGRTTTSDPQLTLVGIRPPCASSICRPGNPRRAQVTSDRFRNVNRTPTLPAAAPARPGCTLSCDDRQACAVPAAPGAGLGEEDGTADGVADGLAVTGGPGEPAGDGCG